MPTSYPARSASSRRPCARGISSRRGSLITSGANGSAPSPETAAGSKMSSRSVSGNVPITTAAQALRRPGAPANSPPHPTELRHDHERQPEDTVAAVGPPTHSLVNDGGVLRGSRFGNFPLRHHFAGRTVVTNVLDQQDHPLDQEIPPQDLAVSRRAWPRHHHHGRGQRCRGYLDLCPNRRQDRFQ